MDNIKERIFYFLENYKKRIIIISIFLLIIILCGLSFLFFYLKKESKKIEVPLVEQNEIQEEQPSEEEKEETPIVDATEMVLVDIKGEVKKPGVYFVEVGSRVQDVITSAGGLTKNASTLVNNLARKVHDEMVVIIYSKTEIEEFKKTKEQESQVIEDATIIKDSIINDAVINSDEIDSNTNIEEPVIKEENKEEIEPDKKEDLDLDKKEETETTKKVSINTGTLEELMTLSGIGESKAKSIIDYRTKNGNFPTLEDIMKVSGIGKSAFEKIKDSISL